jgi:DNA-binding transcriptional ArsR family regulator
MSQWTARAMDATNQAQDVQLRDLAASFKLLADETRLRVLSLLVQHGELNVRTLCEQLDQSQPAVSHHLALLREAGMIRARRDGKHNFYRCIPEKLESVIDFTWRDVMSADSDDEFICPSASQATD